MTNLAMTFRHGLVAALGLAALSLPAAATPPTSAAEIGEFYKPGSGYFLGYLTKDPQVDPADYPDALRFLPPPPAAGSPAAAADEAAYQDGKRLRQGARGEIAVQDAELKSASATLPFACALGVTVSEERTPHLNALLRRVLNDASVSATSTKTHYARVRPFRAHGEASCAPAGDARMKDDSYPSGHAAIGWAWALVLTQLAPDRTEALMARGYDYGQSRVICGAHWQSDVDAGRLVGAAAVARLQSEPLYREQLQLAQAELTRARQAGEDVPNCAPTAPVAD